MPAGCRSKSGYSDSKLRTIFATVGAVRPSANARATAVRSAFIGILLCSWFCEGAAGVVESFFEELKAKVGNK